MSDSLNFLENPDDLTAAAVGLARMIDELCERFEMAELVADDQGRADMYHESARSLLWITRRIETATQCTPIHAGYRLPLDRFCEWMTQGFPDVGEEG